VIAWIFGLLATFMNTFTFIHGIHEYCSLKTETALVNKIFVLLITFVDFLKASFCFCCPLGRNFSTKVTV
jgi:hypothetical protein